MLPPEKNEALKAIKRIYREMAKEIHPDVNGGDSDLMVRLGTLYQVGVVALADGHYGERRAKPTALVIRTKTGVYEVGERITVGPVATIYRTEVDGQPAAIKIARSPKDNDLMRNEAGTLKALLAADAPTEAPNVKHMLPSYMGHVAYREPTTNIERRANLFGALDGFYNLDRVRGDLGPLDPRDMAWMYRRLLTVLGFAHRQGYVHGGLIPESVLIHPEQHGLVLTDWCYSVKVDAKISAVPGSYLGWYAPEVRDKKPATPAADIYQSARLALHLVGLNPPSPMRAFFKGCMLTIGRPTDAWVVLQHFDSLLEDMYGPRKFRPFIYPKES